MECLPAEIPNAIEVDVSNLGMNDAIYLRDVAKDVTWQPVDDPDTMLAHVVTLRVVEEAPAAEGAAAPVAAAPVAGAAEPEVIKKGKTEKEGEAKPEKKK
jgi:large subunit ribosomal protein L25